MTGWNMPPGCGPDDYENWVPYPIELDDENGGLCREEPMSSDDDE